MILSNFFPTSLPLLQQPSDLVVGLNLISPIFLVVVALVVVAIFFAFVFGKSFGRAEWVAFSKIEFIELLKSIILFAIIIALYSIIHSFSVWMLNTYLSGKLPSGVDLIDTTILILRDASIALQVKYITLLEIAHQMKLFGDATAKVGPGTLHLKLPIFVGADLLFQSTELLIFAALTGLHSLNAQIIIFNLIKILTIYLFFPVGLFLRLIPTTREAGNELIAIGISMSILLPTLYIFMYFITLDVIDQHVQEGWENPIYTRDFTTSSKLENILTAVEEGIMKLIVLSSPFFVYVPSNFIWIIQEVSWLLFFALAIPTFAVTITASLIKGIMAFLDIDVSLTFVG